MISEKKISLSSVYLNSGGVGMFFVADRNGKCNQNSVAACRETFSIYFNGRTKYVGFSYGFGKLENIAEFFEIIENKLGLKKKSVFYETDKVAFLVDFSPFWKKDSLTRGFATMFLRCAALYYKQSFYKANTIESALSKYHLTQGSKIKSVINWFFNGHTKPDKKLLSKIYYYGGVAYAIGEYPLEKVKTLLVRP